MSNEFSPYITFLRALASEERISIIVKLLEADMCVSEVEKCFYMEQSTASHHLNLLKRAGIAVCRRQGKQMIYSIDREAIKTRYQEFIDLLKL